MGVCHINWCYSEGVLTLSPYQRTISICVVITVLIQYGAERRGLFTWEFVTCARASNCSSVTSNISFCSLNLRAAILTPSGHFFNRRIWNSLLGWGVNNPSLTLFSLHNSSHFGGRQPKKCGSQRQPTPLTSSCAALHCAGAQLEALVYTFPASFQDCRRCHALC